MFVLRPLVAALALVLTALPAQAKRQLVPPLLGLGFSMKVVIEPETPTETRARMLLELEPLWHAELPKFKTPGKLEQVRKRHMDGIRQAVFSMNELLDKIAAKHPDAANQLRSTQRWCQITWMIHSRTDDTHALDAAERMAILQATHQVCMERAAALAVAEVFSHLGKAPEKPSKSD